MLKLEKRYQRWLANSNLKSLNKLTDSVCG